MDLGLKDATVLVSGGTGGMGRAAAACFAASARNTYMTGANINVDGGSDFT